MPSYPLMAEESVAINDAPLIFMSRPAFESPKVHQEVMGTQDRWNGRRMVRRLIGVRLVALPGLGLVCSALSGGVETTQETHWSFRPVVRPPVPALASRKAHFTNPIDAFVVARLSQNNLMPSPEADRRTLIRRLYFD